MFPLLLADSYYLIQGAETGMPNQLFTGNIPLFSDIHLTRSLLIGLLYLAIAWKTSSLVSRRAAQNRLKTAAVPWLKALIFLAFFLAWDSTLRLQAFAPNGEFIPNPRTFWSANPQLHDAANSVGGGVIGIDREPVQSIFDQEYTGPKPADAWRIIFMGDSQSISTNKDMYSRLSYPKALATVAREQHLTGPDQRNLQTINAGMSGFSSWQGLILLRSDLLPLQPDVVVEAFGYHDSNISICLDTEVITDNPVIWRIRQIMYASPLCLLFRTAVLRNQAAIVDRNAGSSRIQRVTPEQFAANLQTFVELGKQHNFRPVFVIQPSRELTTLNLFTSHEPVIRRVAAQNHIPVVDALTYFQKLPPLQHESLFIDRIHLTPAGHRLMATLVAQTLLRAGYLQSSSADVSPNMPPPPTHDTPVPHASATPIPTPAHDTAVTHTSAPPIPAHDTTVTHASATTISAPKP